MIFLLRIPIPPFLFILSSQVLQYYIVFSSLKIYILPKYLLFFFFPKVSTYCVCVVCVCVSVVSSVMQLFMSLNINFIIILNNRLVTSTGETGWAEEAGPVWKEHLAPPHRVHGLQEPQNNRCSSSAHLTNGCHVGFLPLLSLFWSPGNSNSSVFGHSLSIGSIISVFCEGLKEQIESRTYFYKNSKLVSV